MKYINYLLVLFLAVCLSGCTIEEKDIFDSPSLERLYKQAEEYRKTLIAAENGWIMDYYPEIDQGSGGYTMLVKFHEDGTVDLACEVDTNVPAKTVITSKYDLVAELGVLLKFNTYNDVLHYFGDPSISDVDGMAGDGEFILFDVKPDKVDMRGKKYYNLMGMYPLPADETWDGYLDKVVDTRYWTGASQYSLTVGDKTYKFVNNYNKFVYYYFDEEGVSQNVSVPFVCTDTGIRFYAPFEVDGVTLYSFEYDSARDILVSNETENDIILEYIDPNKYLAETQDTWKFVPAESHSSVGSCMFTIIPGYSPYYIDEISIGIPKLSGQASFGISYDIFAVTRYYYSIYSCPPEIIGNDGLQIRFGTLEGKINAAVTNGIAAQMLNNFNQGNPYFIDYQDRNIPSVLVLTSQADPSMVFTIQK